MQVVALFLLTRGSDICGITSTLAVAFHRFIILRFDPFNKRNLVTGPRLIASCILLWILAVGPLFALQLSPTARSFFARLIAPVLKLVAHSICAACYAVIYLTLSGTARKAGLSGNALVQRIKQNQKVLLTFALVVGTNFVCWTPHCVFYIISYARFDWVIVFVDGVLDLAFWYKILDIVSKSLTGLNGIINPIIYWTRIKDFRLVLNDICLCAKGSTDESVSGNHDTKNMNSDKISTITTASIDGDVSGNPIVST